MVGDDDDISDHVGSAEEGKVGRSKCANETWGHPFPEAIGQQCAYRPSACEFTFASSQHRALVYVAVATLGVEVVMGSQVHGSRKTRQRVTPERQ